MDESMENPASPLPWAGATGDPAGTTSEVPFWLFRIVGNALPPRHAADHPVRTVEYILDHEPRFPECRKTWILNQIIDHGDSRALIEMLHARGEHVVEIPFDPAAAARAHLDASGLPDKLLHPAGPLDTLTAVWRLEWLVRHKSLALANVNRARNAALRLGRPLARWTLPLDGGVMFTAPGWDRFKNAVAASPEAKFAAIGFVRVDSFSDVLQADCPNPQAFEPQIAFRADTIDEYDETLRYGHRNKVELLGRIGASGPWLSNANAPWDFSQPRISRDHGAVCWGGFVVRLPTGATPAVERNNPARWLARFDGITRLALSSDLDRGRAALGARSRWMVYDDPQRLDARTRALLIGYAAEVAQLHEPSARPGLAGDPVGQLVDSIHTGSVITVAEALVGSRSGPGDTRLHRVARFLAESTARVNPRDVWERKPVRALWLLPQVLDLLAAATVDRVILGSVAAWCREVVDVSMKSPDSQPMLAGRMPPTADTLWTKAVVAATSLPGGRGDLATGIVREVPVDLVALARSSGPTSRRRPLREWVDIAAACAALTVIGRCVGVDLLDYRGRDGEGIGFLWEYLGKQVQADVPQDSTVCKRWIDALAPVIGGQPAAEGKVFVQENPIGIPPLWPTLAASGMLFSQRTFS